MAKVSAPKYSPSPYLGGRILCKAVLALPQSSCCILLQDPSVDLYLCGWQNDVLGQVSSRTVSRMLKLGKANVPCSRVKLKLQCLKHVVGTF